MKLTVNQLRRIIKEEVARALHETTGPDDAMPYEEWLATAVDPEAFARVHASIARLGAGKIPVAQLLDLPAWFYDPAKPADPSDARMEAAYRELIKTPVTMDYLEKLAAAHGA